MSKYLAALRELNINRIAYHMDEQGLVILEGKTYKKGIEILERYGV